MHVGAGRRPGVSLRLVIVAAYLAVFGCNGLFDAAVGTVEVIGALTKAIAEQNRSNLDAAARERVREQVIHSRWPYYDAELIQPDEAPPRHDLPPGHWRRERGSALDAPRPARE